MFEKVNPAHPDKIADRIAGALVDLAYKKDPNPKIAVEVLIGHGKCHIITETSVHITQAEAADIVGRIAGESIDTDYAENKQDAILAGNQANDIHCGDNGIFCGIPTSPEEETLSAIAHKLWDKFKADGKYIIDNDNDNLIICQSNATTEEIAECIKDLHAGAMTINPLGYWTGGTDVDTGATNRKLGSDMGRAVTGGGLHGKDLSKADVSVNIYAYLKAQKTRQPVKLCCAIGDDTIDGKPYSEIVETAREYIKTIGGFEQFAEWGLI